MFDRKACKANGKAAFKRNYWMCVLIAVVLVICLHGVTIYETTTSTMEKLDANSLNIETILEESETTTTTSSIPGFLLNILVLNIVAVGCYKFFVLEAKEDAEVGVIFDGFKGKSYGRNLVTMFLRRLFTILWTLLLIVPGIIKGYEYSMIPFILADNPEVDRKEAFSVSKTLTKGSKWKLFVFDLSFIGWWILSLLTFGILSVLYVQPYYYASKTQIYLELKAEHFPEPTEEPEAEI